MNTEQLYNRALESVRNDLTDSERAECHDLNSHRERPFPPPKNNGQEIEMKITLLGTGTPTNPHRFQSAVLVEIGKSKLLEV